MASALVFLALLAVALSAPAKKVEFTVDTYFVGSWMVSTSELPVNGGEIVEKAEKYLFNVTKTTEDSMAVSYVDIPTNTIVEDKSMVASFPTNMSLVLKHFAGKKDLMSLFFHPVSAKDVFAAYTSNPHNTKELVEVSTINHNRFLVKVISKDRKKVTLLTCDRVVSAPQPTFFQKYGQLIMMGVMMLVQTFSLKMQPQPQQQNAEAANAEGGEQKEGEAASTEAAPAADKPKSE